MISPTIPQLFFILLGIKFDLTLVRIPNVLGLGQRTLVHVAVDA